MTSPERRDDPSAPIPLLVAAAGAGLQGVVFVGYAVLEVARTDQARIAMGATTAIFFLLYGLGLILCAWRLVRIDAWARSPVVLAQLIHLGLAWSFWGGQTRYVSVGLAAMSVVVLVGLFQPASVRVLSDSGTQA